jgi:hypothetical protein
MKPQRIWPRALLDFFVIFLMTVTLIRPLFKIKYTALWYSIESTFIADGRFLGDHWPHPLWQPLWYCGTRFDYIYPPALRYGTAALARMLPILPVRAYHLYIAFFYCLGIAGVYLFARVVTKSRGGAWLSALGTLLVSPSFLFFRDVRMDAWHLAPQRLSALVRYGEGPHVSSLAILPFALLCTFLALERRRPALLALAALCCALVVLHNFYGATALAILFPILVWSIWVTHQDHRVWFRAVGIVALACGLTAFWLVPSYFRITLRNMQFVSSPGNSWSRLIAVAAVVAFGFFSFRWARGRRELAYPVFIGGSTWAFVLVVIGKYYFNFRVIGEAARLMPELDFVLILFSVECVRKLWTRDLPGPHYRFALSVWTKSAAVVVIAASFAPSVDYLRHAREIYVAEGDYRQRVEYRVTDWIARNLPGSRCLAIGSIRFWYDAWNDLPQMGGGSEQGLINLLVPQAYYFVTHSQDVQSSIDWMQALGVDAVIVSDKQSQEVYHDFANPQVFEGVLPQIYNDHLGNAIYKVPRRYAGLARVVDTRRMQSFEPIRSVLEVAPLRSYVDAVEHGPDASASAQWDGTDVMNVHANLRAGQSILLQETYDPGWRAYGGGRALRVHPNPVGFMWIDAGPGEQNIQLRFEMPLENRIGRLLTVASLLIVLGLIALANAGLFRRTADRLKHRDHAPGDQRR